MRSHDRPAMYVCRAAGVSVSRRSLCASPPRVSVCTVCTVWLQCRAIITAQRQSSDYSFRILHNFYALRSVSRAVCPRGARRAGRGAGPRESDGALCGARWPARCARVQSPCTLLVLLATPAGGHAGGGCLATRPSMLHAVALSAWQRVVMAEVLTSGWLSHRLTSS